MRTELRGVSAARSTFLQQVDRSDSRRGGRDCNELPFRIQQPSFKKDNAAATMKDAAFPKNGPYSSGPHVADLHFQRLRKDPLATYCSNHGAHSLVKHGRKNAALNQSSGIEQCFGRLERAGEYAAVVEPEEAPADKRAEGGGGTRPSAIAQKSNCITFSNMSYSNW